VNPPAAPRRAAGDGWPRRRGASIRTLVRRRQSAGSLTGLCGFRPEGSETDRLVPTVPDWVRLALESVIRAACPARRKPIAHAAMWALGRGLDRIEVMSEVRDVGRYRQALLDAGRAEDVEPWPYLVPAAGRARIDMKRIDPAVAGRCADLAKALGLDPSVTATVAILVGIVDAPLPERVSLRVEEQVQRFVAALQRRAATARDLLAQMAGHTPQPLRVGSWDV